MSEAAGAPAVTVDARGLACPLPLVRARQAMMLLPAGATMVVLATDPGVRRDFDEWCEVAGHRLDALDEVGGLFTIRLTKRLA